MSPPPSPTFHPQDWALIVEALVTWAGNPTDLDTPRERRAYELVKVIAAAHGCTPSELVLQIDPDWTGNPS